VVINAFFSPPVCWKSDYSKQYQSVSISYYSYVNTSLMFQSANNFINALVVLQFTSYNINCYELKNKNALTHILSYSVYSFLVCSASFKMEDLFGMWFSSQCSLHSPALNYVVLNCWCNRQRKKIISNWPRWLKWYYFLAGILTILIEVGHGFPQSHQGNGRRVPWNTPLTFCLQ
jgi:hypothetical protein